MRLFWKTNRINDLSGTANRYSISDSFINGYGPYISNFGASTTFILENRSAGTGTTLVTGSTFATNQNTWYKTYLRYNNSNINISIFDSDNVLLNSLSTIDNGVSSFSRFYVHGGQEFLTDDIVVREYYSPEPKLIVGTEENTYTKISETFGEIPFWTNSSNPKFINLSNYETKQVIFYVNTTGNINTTEEILGVLGSGDRTESAFIYIKNLIYNINLSLNQKIKRFSENNYLINISLKNFANMSTEPNKSISVYIYLSNALNVTSQYFFDDNINYNVVHTNESLNNSNYNGTLHEWKLVPISSNLGVFELFNDTRDITNSWNIFF